jgi:Cytochrome c biogenesis factor
MKQKIFLCLVLFGALLSQNSFAAVSGNYQKGWDAFGNNNRSEARRFFTLALENPSSKADALLSLALLDWQEMKNDNAFNTFRKFYESSSDPYAYFYGFSSMPFLYESSNILQPARVDFLEKIVADPKMNGTLKAMIYHQLGQHYFACNKTKKAQELFDKIGTIDHWQVLGTFDNTSGSGFNKDWGAVTKPKAEDVLKNRVDADIHWYTPSYNKPDRWFYFDYYFQLNNTIMYAQSFVTSPVEQEVYLRAGTSGSLKIWVNDAQVASIPEERNCDLDIYAYKVKLNQGVNRILVQIGQSEIEAANFMLRITDANAHPIDGLTDVAQYADYTKPASGNISDPLPFFAEEALKAKIKADPDNALNYLTLAETYLRNDKAYEATAILKQLEEKYPKSSLIAYRLAEAYTRAKNQTDYGKQMEKIKQDDPTSFTALSEAVNDAFKSEKYNDALAICQKAKDLYGSNSTTEAWELNIASQQKRTQDVIEMSKTLYKKYPDNADYMNLRYAIENNVSQNSKAATSIVEDYCNNYFNGKAMETLAKIYADQGNQEKSLTVLRQRIDHMPYAIGYLDNLAGVYFKMQRYKDALEVTDRMLQLAPFLPGVFNYRGYIYKNLNQPELAKESFRKSIYYGPTSYDSRAQLRLLENKKEVGDLFPKNDLTEIIAKAPSSKEYPEDNSAILLNDQQLVVYPEGAKEYHYDIAIKILNQAGIETWKEYSIGYNGNTQKLLLDKAEVIKAGGNKVKAETNEDNDRIVFTNLEVNDVLHLDYRIQDFSTGEIAKHFYDQFLMQYSIPSLLNRYSILVPKDKDFKYLVTNGDIKPTISDVEDMKLYQWESRNMPAIKSEPYMSELVDVAPTLSISSIPDWKYISHWYKDLTTNKLKSDFVLKQTISQLLKGKENASAMDKARIFYNYILGNISYSNVAFLHSNYVPQKASRTITTRLGDCKDVATLFVSLCRESGIKANLVLISTRDNGYNRLVLPTIDFNHCIARLDIDNKVYYLELTDNKLPFKSALTVDLNSNILPIPYDTESFGDKLMSMEMQSRPKNRINRNDIITLVNKDMQVQRHSVHYAADASYLRDAYRDLGAEEQLKKITQSVASDFSVPIKVTNPKFKNLENLNDSIVYDCNIEIKNSLQDVAGMKILQLPWTDKISSLEVVAEDTRKYPMELWQYHMEDVTTETITIKLPQGKKFVEIPSNVNLECANARYSLTYDTKTTGTVIAHRTFTRQTETVTIAEYPKFKEFMNLVSESDNKQYAIK